MALRIQTALLLAALAPAYAAQAPPLDGGGGAPTAADRGWIPLDGIAAQAGDRIVTLGELDRFVRDKVGDTPLSTQAEVERATSEALRALVIKELEAQAGQDMGFDPVEIRRRVEYFMADQRRKDGASGFADSLEDQGLDPLGYLRFQEEELYRYMWLQSRLGNPSPVGGRPVRDRYIRPGELRAIYTVNRSDMAEPARVQLEILVIPSIAAGGPELALSSCEAARQRILDGEDFAVLVDELGADFRETGGLSPLLPVNAIRDPGLNEFALRSEVDELSEVLPFTTGNEELSGYLVARLHQREEGGPAPEFTRPEVQRFLRRVFAEKRDERILGRERQALAQDAYSWVNPALGGARAAAPPTGQGASEGRPAPGSGGRGATGSR